MTRQDMIKGVMLAYIHLRETNQSIPDEVLDFIKDASYKEIEHQYPTTERANDTELIQAYKRMLTKLAALQPDSDGIIDPLEYIYKAVRGGDITVDEFRTLTRFCYEMAQNG